MRKGILLACALAASAAGAETAQEQLRQLFKERVENHFLAEGVKRQIEAAAHDPAVTSEAVAETRKALGEARFQVMAAAFEVDQLEREEKEVPRGLLDARETAEKAFEEAQAKHRAAVMEHPKVKAMAEELAKAEARGEELRVEYEALQKQQQPDRQ